MALRDFCVDTQKKLSTLTSTLLRCVAAESHFKQLMLAKPRSVIHNTSHLHLLTPAWSALAFHSRMEPSLSRDSHARQSCSHKRRLTARRSERSSEHLADLSAPLEPFEEIDNALRKLRLCGVLASKVLSTLGFGESLLTIPHC
jgi:hypothetical protein